MKSDDMDCRNYFNDINGGVDMCISRFCDFLVEYGLLEFYRRAEEGMNSSQSNDWYFLQTGVKELDNTKLNEIIISLKEPYQVFKDLTKELDRCRESLGPAEKSWRVVAKQAVQQLEIFGAWAEKYAAAWMQTVLKENSFDVNGFSGLVETHSVVSALITSPMKLRGDFKFFEKYVGNVRGYISDAYVNGDLPPEMKAFEFDAAIDELKRQQVQVEDLLRQEKEFSAKVIQAQNDYWDLRGLLVMMLNDLPGAAKQALFRMLQSHLGTASASNGSSNGRDAAAKFEELDISVTRLA